MVLDASSTPESILSTSLISGDHWVGTTKMGTDDGRTNGTSVVDTNTKVYGTDNLFVVDASIHPDLPTGNTQAIIMVVAEHAAKKIAAFKVANSTAPATPSTPSASVTPEAITPSASASAVPSSGAEKEYTLKEFIAFLEKAASA
jgi:cellobiose dehydrogenase (acceptor)